MLLAFLIHIVIGIQYIPYMHLHIHTTVPVTCLLIRLIPRLLVPAGTTIGKPAPPPPRTPNASNQR